MRPSPRTRPIKPEMGPDMAAAIVKRIRFLPEPAAGDVICRFTEPRAVAAASVSIEPSGLSLLPADAENGDLVVIIAPTALGLEDHPDGPKPVVLKNESGTVRWRPGRAVLECSAANSESLLAAVIGFAFLEGELRRLEQELLPYEISAPADAAIAYRIERSSRAEWERLAQTMKHLSLLRLTFARLEPHLASPPRTLDLEGRRAAAGLVARSGVRARLESFGNRLEACEDLYEGAVDRITDFRWYRKGEILETIIIVLLVLEVILMGLQWFK